MSNKNKHWVPEIVYENDDGEAQLGNLPLIHVPNGEKMPTFLLIWEATETGEFEPGPDGEELPIVQWELRQYAHMDVLKSKLSHEDYDKVRVALGLQPLNEATKNGQQITAKIRENLANSKKN
jgi:hypothetical protein